MIFLFVLGQKNQNISCFIIIVINVKISAIIVVIKNFFFNIGLFGAPGSFPNSTLCSFLTPIGRIKNKINHHKITKITTKVSKITPALILLMFQKNPWDEEIKLVCYGHHF